MTIKIILAIIVLVCIIVYAIAKSMIDGNNIGNFIDEEEINHDSAENKRS